MPLGFLRFSKLLERLSLAGVGFDSATITSGTVSALQVNAENRINGSLNNFYKVPFTGTIPALINEMCAIKTAIHVFDIIYGTDSFKENEMVEFYKKEYNATMKMLRSRELTLDSRHEIDASGYFIGSATKTFDFSTTTTTWFDIT